MNQKYQKEYDRNRKVEWALIAFFILVTIACIAGLLLWYYVRFW